MCHPLLIVAIIFSTQAPVPAKPNTFEVRRLARVASYLVSSGVALYGARDARAHPPVSNLDALWERAGEQYGALYGNEKAKTRLAAVDRTAKALEELTFEILKTLWGEGWIRVVQP